MPVDDAEHAKEMKLVSLTGFKHIKHMTKAEIIDELLAWQRQNCEALDLNQLRLNLVNCRMDLFKERLFKEAGISAGPMGMVRREDEGDEGHDYSST